MNFTKEEILKTLEKENKDCFDQQLMCDNCVWAYGDDECVSKEECGGNFSEFKYVGDWELVESKAVTDRNGKPFEYSVFDIKKRDVPLESVKEYIFKSPIHFQRYNDLSIESVREYLKIRDKSLEILDIGLNKYGGTISVFGSKGISLYVCDFPKDKWNSGKLPYEERMVNYLVHQHIRNLEKRIQKFDDAKGSVEREVKRLETNLGTIIKTEENREFYTGKKESLEWVIKVMERAGLNNEVEL